MKLMNALHVLQSPESTPTGTSGNSGGGGEAPQPPGTGLDTQGEVIDRPEDNEDWLGESAPDNETPTGDDTASPSPDDQPKPGEKPAAAEPPKPGEKPVPPKPEDKPEPPKPGEEAPKPQPKPEPQPETAEARAAREKAEQEADQKRFTDLVEYYKIPEEMSERLRTEPELVLPELAAKVHQAVFRGLLQWNAQSIPQLFVQHQQMQEANVRTKEAFFGRWPSLKDHEKEVIQIGTMHRQMNPKMSAAERLEKVGQLACAALGITPDPKPGEAVPPPPKPGQKRVAAPAKPVKPGNPQGSSSAAPAPSDNVFENMAQQMLEEDEG